MSHFHSSDPLQRLLAAIDDTTYSRQIEELIECCTVALDNLGELDDALHRIQEDSGKSLEQMRNAGPFLQAMTDSTQLGARRLELELSERWGLNTEAEGEELEFDIDLDLGGEAGPAAGTLMGESDIEQALGLLPTNTDDERPAAVQATLEVFARTLSAQLNRFDSFFADACERQDWVLALRQLDAHCNSVTDGIFALVVKLCEIYLGKVERSQILPGRNSTLGKALLLRTELAKLRRIVRTCNTRVQDPEADEKPRQRALERLVEQVNGFVDGEVFSILRSADRRELIRLQRRLTESTGDESRAACTDCTRFLESLTAINRRGVLLEHDSAVSKEIAELLDAAPAVTGVSETGAVRLVKDAYAQAHRLYGRDDTIDELLAAWRTEPPDLSRPEALHAAAEALAACVR